MEYHALCPFSRDWLIPWWLRELPAMKVVWHPITEKPYDWPKVHWIQPFVYDRTGARNVPLWAMNKWVDGWQGKFVEDDYYFTLADDDWLEPGFIDKISGINTDFIVVSAARGQHQVSSYPTWPLIAMPEHMNIGQITGSQLISKGRVMKLARWTQENVCGDGRYIMDQWSKYPHESFTFLPDVWERFNFMEPGRYDEAVPIIRELKGVAA